MLPVRAQAPAAAQHPRRVCHQVKGVMAMLLAARGDEPDRGGQIRRNPGPIMNRLCWPLSRWWHRPPDLVQAVYLREGGRRPAAGTFIGRTWTGYQDKVA